MLVLQVTNAGVKRPGHEGLVYVGFELVQFGAHCFLFCSILINR